MNSSCGFVIIIESLIECHIEDGFLVSSAFVSLCRFKINLRFKFFIKLFMFYWIFQSNLSMLAPKIFQVRLKSIVLVMLSSRTIFFLVFNETHKTRWDQKTILNVTLNETLNTYLNACLNKKPHKVYLISTVSTLFT